MKKLSISKIMAGFIYSHVLPDGIKIGWASDYKKRLATYQTHGDEIKELKVINVDSQVIDNKLKKILIKLNRQVKGKKATEVYKLTPIETTEILSYIEKHQCISDEIVEGILNPPSSIEVLQVCLEDIRSKYGNIYIPFEYQRETIKSHHEKIKSYILENYMKHTFYLGNVALFKLSDDKFEIIDGNHRCTAIHNIERDHPSLKQKIIIHVYIGASTIVDRFQVFRNINRSKKMPEIYLQTDRISGLRSEVLKLLDEKYGTDLIVSDPKPTELHVMRKDLFDNFLSLDTINQALEADRFENITPEIFAQYLFDINDLIIEAVCSIDENILYSNIPITESIEQQLVTLRQEINQNKKFTAVKPIIDSIAKIKSRSTHTTIKRGTKLITTKKKREPFLLGFNTRISLYDLKQLVTEL